MSSNKKIQRAWTMYDWANSTYNLVITSTIFPAYYVHITTSSNPNKLSYVDFFGIQVINTALQNYALAFVFFLLAALCHVGDLTFAVQAQQRSTTNWAIAAGAWGQE
jgi:UMF1 family MFS transporter